ncbi:MAG: anti-sigma factor family protein [Terriglobales bacterium]
MNCSHVREHFLDWMSAEPAPGELRDHLNACASCSAELASLRKTMALLDEWKAPEDTSPYFYTRLRARLREEESRPVGWLAWLRKPALALSLAALLVAGIGLIEGGGRVQNEQSKQAFVPIKPGTAVGDLQYLDKNHEMLADFELLDGLEGSNAQQ